jgi:hypothetical protein
MHARQIHHRGVSEDFQKFMLVNTILHKQIRDEKLVIINNYTPKNQQLCHERLDPSHETD